MVARKAVEQELSRERILEAARDLFVQYGYQSVSMRQVARELGYSHGAIYYHFKNKAELFYALVQQDFLLLDTTLEELIALPQTTADEKLRRILLGFIEFGLRHQSHYEIMFLIKDEGVKSYLHQTPNDSYEKFSRVVSDLSENKVSISAIWSLFLSLHGFISHYCRSGQTFEEVEELAKAHVSYILQGISK